MKFKKIIIRALTVIIIVALILLIVNTLVGENITFQSLSTTINTRLAFNAIKKGNFESATRFIGFWGFNEDRTEINEKYIEEEKKRFVKGLEQLFSNKDITIDLIENINIKTDDGFTQGTVELYLNEGGTKYKITLMVAFQRGKVCPMSVYNIGADEKVYGQAEIFAEKLIRVIRTYYPG